MVNIGYDASSLGLLKWDYSNDDERYAAIKADGGVKLYALKPQYYNPASVSFLQNVFQTDRGNLDIDTRVYVGSVNVKGFTSHNEYLTETVDLAPVILLKNPINQMNPADYAASLQDITAERYGSLFLNYGSTIEPFELDIRDLPDIELNADANISVTVGSTNISTPLLNLLDPSRGISPLVTVVPSHSHVEGFDYVADFAGRNFTDTFTTEYKHAAIASEYERHMLQNRHKDKAFVDSNIFILGNKLILGEFEKEDLQLTTIQALGGIGSIFSAFTEFMMRAPTHADMKNQITNLGGSIIKDAIGQSFDTLVQIVYPIKKKLPLGFMPGNYSPYAQYIVPGDFEVNRPKSFTVNTMFPDMETALRELKEQFKGTIIGGDFQPAVDYGEYTGHFKRMISMGVFL